MHSVLARSREAASTWPVAANMVLTHGVDTFCSLTAKRALPEMVLHVGPQPSQVRQGSFHGQVQNMQFSQLRRY